MVTLTRTNPDLISQTGYHVVLWIFFALCLLAFAGRAYIRYVCHHRLLFEDWLMLLALGCHLSVDVIGQLNLVYMYEITAVNNGGPMGPNFVPRALQGVKTFGIMLVLDVSGIWLIKLNFLLFFYRLGHMITAYRITWWICFVFSIACGIGCFGIFQYPCMFGSVDTIFVECATVAALKDTYVRTIMTAVLDIASDFAILCFPVYILWKVRITLRKKILLSAVFGMVGFTIAVTVVRASIFGGVYKDVHAAGDQDLNMNWISFWLYVEFTVSFIIACLVSFRTLFVRNEQQSEAKDAEQRNLQSNERRRRGLMERMRRLHDSVLDTCRTWEGEWDDSNASFLRTVRLPKPPSGRLSVDFSRDTGGSSDLKLPRETRNEYQV